ncbi:extracellular solute-binding protein [Rhizobium sp. BK376]|uniref:ABC transporter substrate-binding protein n=2 Tax=Rhizobium/Agrobacterium group TaxID=227290 RepID=UPI001FDF42A0|nr:extracellular solute-binding protein [Rhizobium sp. BK376]
MTMHSTRTDRRSTRYTLRLAAAALVSLAAAAPAFAQSTIADLAKYDGADRMEKLIAGAKQEGTLTIYTSTPVDDINAITDAFTKKYGIKVDVWRGSSEDLLTRGVTETKAGRYTADVYETDGPGLEALTREQMLQPVSSPTFKQLMPQAVQDHNNWVGTRLNVMTSAYNTNLVDASSVPKTWTDFLDPQWKGKLGVEAEDYDWMAAIVKRFPSEQEGLDFFRKLVSTNGLSVRSGHTLLTNLVASGEVPLSMTVYEYKAQQLKADGAPVDWFGISPIPSRVNGIGVSAHATHPNAALLLQEFEMTDAQAILVKRGFTATNLTLFPLPKGVSLDVIDSKVVLDEGKKWQDLFEKIVLQQQK